MGAPCLATGAATLQDVFPPAMLGPVISFWALAAFGKSLKKVYPDDLFS